MSLVIKLTFEILIIVAIGVIAAKTKIIDNNGKEKLSSLLVDLLLPVSMLASSQQPFTVNNLKGTVYIAIIAFVYYLIAFATRETDREDQRHGQCKGGNVYTAYCLCKYRIYRDAYIKADNR